MIDLHTHSLLSDGELLPSELVRRAAEKGFKAIAITDHVDMSNIDFVLPRLVQACKVINKYWKIKAIPGVEITHVPIEEIPHLVKFAKKSGAKIIIGHGETIAEPVLPGTNRAFIKAKVDILAHPGRIKEKDVAFARKQNVFLEITTRINHSKTNKHVLRLARKFKASLVLNTDTHKPSDFLDKSERIKFLKKLGLSEKEIKKIINNAVRLINA